MKTHRPHRGASRSANLVVLVVAASAFAGSAIATVRARRAAGPAVDPAEIDRYVADYRARTGLPGVAIAITRGREIVHVAGYGHDGSGAPITARTRLPIASLSKSFTALAMMQLVEKGSVALDEPVRRYLPEFSMADSRSDAITVRQILAHTSGMSDTEFPEKSGPAPRSLRDGVAMLRTARLAADPGARRDYHNPNYWVAARLVEVVSGEPFARYLERHVFQPLGMASSAAVGSLRDAAAVADGHVRVFGAHLAVPEASWFLGGAAGVVTDAEDLARWLIVQNGAGVGTNGSRVASEASVAAMHDGLGWVRDSASSPPTISHSGWMFTFTAHQILLPSTGYGIAVIANRGLSLGPDDSAELANALVAMTEGAHPTPGAPVGRIVDAVLALLAIATIAVGIRALRSARSPGRPVRARWRVALGLLPWVVPIVLLAGLRGIASIVFGGRDGSWSQLLYLAPALVAWLVVGSAFGAAVIIARLRAAPRAAA